MYSNVIQACKVVTIKDAYPVLLFKVQTKIIHTWFLCQTTYCSCSNRARHRDERLKVHIIFFRICCFSIDLDNFVYVSLGPIQVHKFFFALNSKTQVEFFFWSKQVFFGQCWSKQVELYVWDLYYMSLKYISAQHKFESKQNEKVIRPKKNEEVTLG